MPRIHQLPPHEAHKIAAGEVVDRPANVVKELVENALDAQATQITLYIEEAGKKLIRIVDNGHGMDAEDAKLCFGHHATSKIRSVDDLQSISTFGFRGEALSSIAAVSEVTLITKEPTAEEGIKIRIGSSRMEPETFVSSNPGTDISIENLFFNVPARKKFLKTNDTEWRQIVLLFQAFCLDYWSVSFKLFHNDQLIHNCPATTDLSSRIAQLWDHTFSTAMLPLSAEKNGIAISGAVSHHHYVRYDRNQMFFFVNKRWIKNQHLSRALVKGYMNVLPPARYPAAFIFITVPPQEVDINIHPRKEEAQFLHPRMVELLMQEAVKKTLENNVTQKINRPEHSTTTFDFDAPVFHEPGNTAHGMHQPPSMNPTPAPYSTSRGSSSFMQSKQPRHAERTRQEIALSFTQPPPHNPPLEKKEVKENFFTSLSSQTTLLPKETSSLEAEQYTIVGQLHKTYIALEHPEGLYLVDQHAAHERILYEQFRQRFHTVAATQLLFPIIITLNKDDIATLTPYLSFIAEQGIGIELFGEQQVKIHATPILIKDIPLDELLHTVIGWINEARGMESAELRKLLTEKLHAQMACKAAVKAGDVLTLQAMEELLHNLQKTANRFSCPHGRPTGWLITTHEIEKKFKRKI
jgi:DNA mismatch repair protein MutL